MIPLASIIYGKEQVAVHPSATLDDVPVVPAKYLAIEITADPLPDTVNLDGRPVPLSVGHDKTRGFLMLDAFRSVGFHVLRVDGLDFVFATEDGKLRIKGVLNLLDYLGGEGLAWSGQIFFSDGTAIRHAKIDYAWLSISASRILTLADSITARPIRRLVSVKTPRPSAASRPFLADTIRLLKRNIKNSLEPDDAGVFAISGETYSPRVVISRRSFRSSDTIGNRRATCLLLASLELCKSLQMHHRPLPNQIKRDLDSIATEISKRLSLFPFAHLKVAKLRVPDSPSAEENSDDRYRQVYDLWEEISKNIGWEAGLKPASHLAYVNYADQIYQAFVALVIARAFAAEQVFPSIAADLPGPLFRSARHDIYYDSVPPKPAFINWRDASNRPSDQRPDLVIIDKKLKKGILLDAKYRVEASGRLPGSALEEAQVYLQSFCRKSIVICYPGPTPGLSRVIGGGFTILEVALGPYPEIVEYARHEVRPAIEGLLEPLSN
jgi:hypothetical protein